MTQKQYADMATIMQFGRFFAEQIRRCMENAGLMEQKYNFELRITNGCYLDGEDVIKVQLEKAINSTEPEEFNETSMEQYKFGRKGWFVHYDPIAEEGSVPSEVRISKARKTYAEAEGKTGSKPYPPDGLWISSRDYPADVGGGE